MKRTVKNMKKISFHRHLLNKLKTENLDFLFQIVTKRMIENDKEETAANNWKFAAMVSFRFGVDFGLLAYSRRLWKRQARDF